MLSIQERFLIKSWLWWRVYGRCFLALDSNAVGYKPWCTLLMVFCYQNCSDLLWEKIVLVIEKNFWNSRLNAKNLQIYKLRQTFEWANVNPSNCLTRSNVVNILVTDASGIRIGDWLNCTVQIHLRWCKYLGKKRRKKKLDSYLFINTGTLLP